MTATDLDSTRRDDLTGTAAALANTLDDWLFSQHGVTSGAHCVGTFLELLHSYGLAVVPRSAATVYAEHQPADAGCSCGWGELGRSYFRHLDEMLQASAEAAPHLEPREMVAPLGAAGPPPDSAMGSLTTWAREDGSVGIEGSAGPILSVSLALFAQQHDGTRFIHVKDGMVVIEGFDRSGAPVQHRYRAVGLQLADPRPDYLAAQEGGFLLLELDS